MTEEVETSRCVREVTYLDVSIVECVQQVTAMMQFHLEQLLVQS